MRPERLNRSVLAVILALTLGMVLAALKPAPARAAGLEQASIAELQARMDRGELTAEQLTRFYLRRIARLDRHGPGLRAVIAINPAALDQARALDAERKARGPRGPLHGVPILVKDNIETADAMPTTAGSLALADNLAGVDAPIIARLRAAGAIILGKTNLSEWANFRSDHSISGWSAVGGLVRNPYALDRSACGSSSGSAVAVAAGFAAAAVGTETDGSITCPAAVNGVVGLKPTLGRLPATGIVPIAHSQDAPGPITRTVGDAALMLSVMAARGPGMSPPPPPPNLKGRRLGVLRFAAGRTPLLDPVYEAALARLRQGGAVLVEVSLPDPGPVAGAEAIVLNTEFRADLNAYLARTPAAVKSRSLSDLIAFNAAHPDELALFGQEVFQRADQTRGLDDPAYRTALVASKRLAGPEGIDKLIVDNNLDGLVAPTAGPAWRVTPQSQGHFAGAFSTFPAVAGYPHLTVPMGQVRGLPVGLSFIGPAASDDQILALGLAFEQTGAGFVAPTYVASINEPAAKP